MKCTISEPNSNNNQLTAIVIFQVLRILVDLGNTILKIHGMVGIIVLCLRFSDSIKFRKF